MVGSGPGSLCLLYAHLRIFSALILLALSNWYTELHPSSLNQSILAARLSFVISRCLLHFCPDCSSNFRVSKNREALEYLKI